MLAFVGLGLFHRRLQCNAESDGKNIPPWRGCGFRRMGSARVVIVAGGRALPIQKIHLATVMLARDVDQAATGVPACGMGQRECAVNPALGFKLTLDLDPVSGQ